MIRNISQIWGEEVIDFMMHLYDTGTRQSVIVKRLNMKFGHRQFTKGEVHGKIWRIINARQKLPRCPHCRKRL